MIPPDPRTHEIGNNDHEGWWTRDRILVLVLAAATVLLFWLCYRIAKPFLPALAWALALAVVTHPLHRWFTQRIQRPALAAGLAVAVVGVVIIVPAIWVGREVAQQAGAIVQKLHSGETEKQWEQALTYFPQVRALWDSSREQIVQAKPTQNLPQTLGKVVAGSIGLAVQFLVTLFLLFFLFRDHRPALNALRNLVPLSHSEADQVFRRVGDTIHASIYGSVGVAAIQGALGGLMFWWLGLPAPMLWGVVMGLLAIVPVLGAFVVWIPAAIYLGVSGEWGKALILTAWGTLVIGLIDNLLYPVFVGQRLRLHTALVFVAVVGSLALFGASGIVLGPVVLALTHAVLDIWRRRTRFGQPAEQAVPPPAHDPPLGQAAAEAR